MIRIREIKVHIEANKDTLMKKIADKLHVKPQEILHVQVIKRSLDARLKPQLFYVYEVDVEVLNEAKILKKHLPDVSQSIPMAYQVPQAGNGKLSYRPIVVGSGPAGLFATYLLAKEGYHPLLIERGSDIDTRVKKVQEFWASGVLDEKTNVQFGEGGAGTFSDGKLNTMVKDSQGRGRKVFEVFVECGAPEDILYEHKPHIGTDLLRDVIVRLREKIKEYGGDIRYLSCLTDIVVKNSVLQEIILNQKEHIACDCLILALGHSARDTFTMLYQKGLDMIAKPFAVGLRVEHLQKEINESQYGLNYPKILPPASYKLTYTTKNNRGVYSFCMCPGGYVVNASSCKGMLVINGMSKHKRDSENANAAIVVTVGPKDFGEGALDGMKFQMELEENAYLQTNGKIPVQTYKDFVLNKPSDHFGCVLPVVKGQYCLANLNTFLPKYITDSIKEAMDHFGKIMPAFQEENALFFGIETRTSSPVRIKRDDTLETNIQGIYACGEGSGYAGGITTSAMDGLRCAEEIIKKFQKLGD